MADGMTVQIEGLDALSRRMKGVKEDLRGKGGKFAGRRAAQVVARNAAMKWRQLDDPATGQSIADNIWAGGSKFPGVRFSSRRFKQTGDIKYRIGVQGTARTSPSETKDTSAGSPTPHWRLLEFGTESIAPKGFMRRAARESFQGAFSEFVREYDKKLTRLLKAKR